MFVMAKTCISRSWLFCASGLLLIAAGCAQPTATVPVVAPPIPSGQARVWFYRPWEPSESLNLALIDMNGSSIGGCRKRQRILSRCSARALSHRAGELQPGLRSGQKCRPRSRPAALRQNHLVGKLGVSISGSRTIRRDTFYAWLIPPEVAQIEIARDRGGI